MAKHGKTIPIEAMELDCPPESEYIWSWFCEMWPDITKRDIKDYFDLYSIKPKHFEIDCLLNMVKAANSIE